MVDKYFRQFTRAGYVAGIAIMIASLPQSKLGLSIAQFILTGAWILERYNLRKFRDFYKGKPTAKVIAGILPLSLYLVFDSMAKGFKVFFKNTPALIFSSIFLLHIAGLIFTTDFDYALKDLRTKIPILILPLFISTSEAFGKRQFYWLMLLFTASVLVRTMINSWYLFNHYYIDIRDISKPVSHIIVALLISFALFTISYLVFRNRNYTWRLKSVLLILFCWFIVFLVISQGSTGIVVTIITGILLLMILLFKSKNRFLKASFFLSLIICIGGISIYMQKVVHEYYTASPVDTAKLDHFTLQGNRYVNYPRIKEKENGNYIFVYIQWDELRKSWNSRSRINFDSLDRRNQQIKFTLIRFLASRGLRKDADGVSKLTGEDIGNIENGIANVVYRKEFSIRGKIYEILYGYDKYMETGDPTGSSLIQRMEFWRASLGIIGNNWLTGVGTGDMNEAFQEQYMKMKSPLAAEARWRSHNQFLSIFVGFGIFGFLWFLFAILYPPLKMRKFSDFFFLVFFINIMLSMVPEDTIESQAGVTFFAFFYSLLLFGRKEEDPV
jgi:O-antigen ligase